MALTDTQLNEIERAAQTVVEHTALETEEQFEAAVTRQLERITGRPLAKRRNTIRILAQVDIDPEMSRRAVFKRPDVVSMGVFYNPDKGYYHDPLYREVLETVRGLYQKWDMTQRARAHTNAQAEHLRMMLQIARKSGGRALEMLEYPLFDEEEVVDEDGTVIMVRKPVGWTMRDVATLAQTADKLGRSALGLETERTVHDINWREGLPSGVTPEQAEQARLQMAKLLATQSLKTLGSGDDD